MPLTRLSKLATRALRVLDPEDTHRLAIRLLKAGVLPEAPVSPDNLATTVWGRSFAHPLGIAAGFDKDGEAMAALLRGGAGFVEIGAVTPLPQPGNPRPRVFRLPQDQAVINRYGFNSAGHDVVRARLAEFRRFSRMADGIVGVNLGMNKDSKDPVAAYTEGVRAFAADADFLTINVSSPNTPGLRELLQEDLLFEIVSAAKAALSVAGSKAALLVKLSPDLNNDAVDGVVERLTKGHLVDGWIVANTTIARPSNLRSVASQEMGGLSGRPLKERTTAQIARVFKLCNGAPIIGAGGVASGADAYAKIRAGASLVQIYTSLVYNGPLHLLTIADELSRSLAKDGISSVGDATGLDHCK
ncbi:MAG: quinone-dependent dihydroorotate dehydrogenase [Alphaproteobacteria bacterium]